VYGHVEALAFHVEGNVLAHHGETDQTDVSDWGSGVH
jgi:hypothetical protein